MDGSWIALIVPLLVALIGSAGLIGVALVNRGSKGVEETLRERLTLMEERLADCEEEQERLRKALERTEIERDQLKNQIAEWIGMRTSGSGPT